ncbi:MAG: CBS domain-containing protein [archaeon]|nr:MAG: CBS domain-containing protein [archaeon]
MDLSELVRKDFLEVGPDAKISEVASHMIRGEEAVVVCDENFIGIISSNQLIDRDYPAETKTRTLVRKNIPRIEDDIGSAGVAKLFLENNVKAVPVFSKDKLAGLLYEKDFIRNSECLSDTKKTLEDIASVPDVIEKDESIGKARTVLKEKNISRLPVVDERGKLSGIIDIEDFLKTVNPREGMGRKDSAGDSVPEFKLPVTTIMDENPLVTEENITCSKIIKLFKKHNKSYIIMVRNKEPVGIVTSKDILELMASLESQKGVYVQINGLGETEDEFEKDKIDSMIIDSVQKIGKIHGPMEYFFVHIKSSQREGEQKLFSIRTRALTPVGLYVSKASGWNVITTTDEALDRLERQIIEDREKKMNLRSPRNA